MNMAAGENDTVTSSAKKKVFCHQVRKYLREYGDVTGIQGFRYVTEKRTRAEKVFWAIVLLISLAGCIYMIREIVTKFRTSPVIISFASRDTPIFKIPFPAVTICPESKSSRGKFNYSDVMRRLLINDSVTKEELESTNYISLLCADFPLHHIDSNKTMNDSFFATLMDVRPEVNTYAMLFRKPVYNFTTIITDQGICYTFNMLDRSEIFKDQVGFFGGLYSGPSPSQYGENGYHHDADLEAYPRRALMPGAEYSLEMYIKGNRNDNDYVCNSFRQGYRVMIHHPFDMPQFSSDYIRVPFDKEVTAVVLPELVTTSEAVRNLKPEERNCYFMNERPLKYFKIYTQSNCLLECVANHTLSKCGCVPFYMPWDFQTSFCGRGSTHCVNKAKFEAKYHELDSKLSTSIKEKGNRCDCRPLCTDLKYDVETARNDFHFKELLEVTKKLLNLTHSVETEEDGFSLSVLFVYFKTEQFITLERNTLYGMSDLISNFGGILGLFTGFSLITIAEMIYFATIRIFYNRRLYGIWSGFPN